MIIKIFIFICGLAFLTAGPFLIVRGLSSSAGSHGGTKVTHAAPGPVAGLGLPALVAAGALVWYRTRAKRQKT